MKRFIQVFQNQANYVQPVTIVNEGKFKLRI